MDRLVALAREVRARAYAPYSGYLVGAALRDERGEVFTGVNVENASYGATICAERGAVLAMVAGGGRRIVELAVATRDGGPPCGMCLQVLSEFGGRESRVAVSDETGNVTERTLGDLIPHPFASDHLERPGDSAR